MPGKILNSGLGDFFRDGLLKDTVPWWQNRFIDKKYGGYLHYRDADGTLLGTDKPVWLLARTIWMWSLLHNEAGQKSDWLQVAENGVNFMLEHAFDADGRMFFLLAADGRPLRKRRYLFTETFGVIALAEYSKAAGSEAMLERAKDLYRLIVMYNDTPGLLQPKVISSTRQTMALGMRMMLIYASQVIREVERDELYDSVIRRCIREILGYFAKPEKKCLLEFVLPGGGMLDTPEGRTVNPGHSVEACWFIMEEARRDDDRVLLGKACEMLEWSLERGWDGEYGGLLAFTDCDGKPPNALEHDMKLWWPHTEALYACLLACRLTGEEKWADWYRKIHLWAFKHFPDSENGEWFGYLRRDGTISSTVKGNMWKGPFHLPRCQLLCWKLLEQVAE